MKNIIAVPVVVGNLYGTHDITENCLKKIAKSSVRKPIVSESMEPLGIVSSALTSEGKLFIRAKVKEETSCELFLVPVFVVQVSEIFEILHFMTTLLPRQIKGLLQIREVLKSE